MSGRGPLFIAEMSLNLLMCSDAEFIAIEAFLVADREWYNESAAVVGRRVGCPTGRVTKRMTTYTYMA